MLPTIQRKQYLSQGRTRLAFVERQPGYYLLNRWTRKVIAGPMPEKKAKQKVRAASKRWAADLARSGKRCPVVAVKWTGTRATVAASVGAAGGAVVKLQFPDQAAMNRFMSSPEMNRYGKTSQIDTAHGVLTLFGQRDQLAKLATGFGGRLAASAGSRVAAAPSDADSLISEALAKTKIPRNGEWVSLRIKGHKVTIRDNGEGAVGRYEAKSSSGTHTAATTAEKAIKTVLGARLGAAQVSAAIPGSVKHTFWFPDDASTRHFAHDVEAKYGPLGGEVDLKVIGHAVQVESDLPFSDRWWRDVQGMANKYGANKGYGMSVRAAGDILQGMPNAAANYVRHSEMQALVEDMLAGELGPLATAQLARRIAKQDGNEMPDAAFQMLARWLNDIKRKQGAAGASLRAADELPPNGDPRGLAVRLRQGDRLDVQDAARWAGRMSQSQFISAVDRALMLNGLRLMPVKPSGWQVIKEGAGASLRAAQPNLALDPLSASDAQVILDWLDQNGYHASRSGGRIIVAVPRDSLKASTIVSALHKAAHFEVIDVNLSNAPGLRASLDSKPLIGDRLLLKDGKTVMVTLNNGWPSKVQAVDITKPITGPRKPYDVLSTDIVKTIGTGAMRTQGQDTDSKGNATGRTRGQWSKEYGASVGRLAAGSGPSAEWFKMQGVKSPELIAKCVQLVAQGVNPQQVLKQALDRQRAGYTSMSNVRASSIKVGDRVTNGGFTGTVQRINRDGTANVWDSDNQMDRALPVSSLRPAPLPAVQKKPSREILVPSQALRDIEREPNVEVQSTTSQPSTGMLKVTLIGDPAATARVAKKYLRKVGASRAVGAAVYSRGSNLRYAFADEKHASQFVAEVFRMGKGLKAAYRGRLAVVLAPGVYAADVSDIARSHGGKPATEEAMSNVPIAMDNPPRRRAHTYVFSSALDRELFAAELDFAFRSAPFTHKPDIDLFKDEAVVWIPDQHAMTANKMAAKYGAIRMSNVPRRSVQAGMFEDLAKGRHRSKMQQMKFAVVALKKDGTPSKPMPPGRSNPISDYFEDEASAQARVKQMEQMNPGRKFTVVKLDNTPAVSASLGPTQVMQYHHPKDKPGVMRKGQFAELLGSSRLNRSIDRWRLSGKTLVLQPGWGTLRKGDRVFKFLGAEDDAQASVPLDLMTRDAASRPSIN